MNKVLKGDPNQNKVVVRLYEADIPTGKTIKKLMDDSVPEITIDENVIMFLRYDDSPFNRLEAHEYFVPSGMKQGKWGYKDSKVSNGREIFTELQLVEEVSNSITKFH